VFASGLAAGPIVAAVVGVIAVDHDVDAAVACDCGEV
jgi:hypothetical protein